MADVKQQLLHSVHAVEQAEAVAQKAAVEVQRILDTLPFEMVNNARIHVADKFRDFLNCDDQLKPKTPGLTAALMALLTANPQGLDSNQITAMLIGKYRTRSQDHRGSVKATLAQLKSVGRITANHAGLYTLVANPPPRAKKLGSAPIIIPKMTQYFHATNNEWADIAHIAKTIGSRPSAIRACLESKKYKNMFDHQRDKGRNKTVWRLRITPGTWPSSPNRPA